MFLVTNTIEYFLPKTILTTIIQVIIGGITYLLLLIVTKDKFFNTYIYSKLKLIFKKNK